MPSLVALHTEFSLIRAHSKGDTEDFDESQFNFVNGSLKRPKGKPAQSGSPRGNTLIWFRSVFWSIVILPFLQPLGGGNTFDMFKQMSQNPRDDLLKQLEDAAKDLSISDQPHGQEKEQVTSFLFLKVMIVVTHTWRWLQELDKVEVEKKEQMQEDQPEIEDQPLSELEVKLERNDSLLLQEYFAIDDMNKAGLQRAKKDVIQQEVEPSSFSLFARFFFPFSISLTNASFYLCRMPTVNARRLLRQMILNVRFSAFSMGMAAMRPAKPPQN